MEEHIKSLIKHGARVEDEPLTLEFYRRIVRDCREKGMKVRTFALALPGLEEYSFLLAIWADGHVDSGCEDTVRWCMKENRSAWR